MKFRPSIRNCDSGFTVLEMLVASSIGLLVLTLLLSSTLASKNLFRADVVRTRINQDLRSALDIVGSQVRVAGENFVVSFFLVLELQRRALQLPL